MATDFTERGELKKQLYDRFRGRIETDVIDMVFHGCNYQVEDAVSALSTMCLVPEEAAKKDDKAMVIESLAVSNMVDASVSKKQKTMFILRGLPGSGKTYLANQMKQKGDVILSTDNYFTSGSRTFFRGDQLEDAHKWNVACARSAMRKENVNNVFIDNTNTRCWEMKPYVLAALNFGYNVKFLLPQTPWAWDINELERRNTHGVPRVTLIRMMERFEKVATVEKVITSVTPEAKPPRPHHASPVFNETKEAASTEMMVNSDFQNLELEGSSIFDMPKANKTNAGCNDMVIDSDFDRELDVAFTIVHSKTNIVHERKGNPKYREEIGNLGVEYIDKDKQSIHSKLDSFEISDDMAKTQFEGSESNREKPRFEGQSRLMKESSIDQDALQFLHECFPGYEQDVLESVFMRFDGDMERICHEIMEQPFVKMNAADMLQNIDESSRSPVDFDNFELDRADKDDVIMDSNDKSDINLVINKAGGFLLRLDEKFINSLKRKHGETEDTFEEDELEFPVDKIFAEEIYRHWKHFHKAKRKRIDEDSRKGKGKDVGNIQSENTKKLKGSFSPWSSRSSGHRTDFVTLEADKPIWDLSQEQSENRLYAMFPTVPKYVLDDVFQAMSCDIDAAIQAVKASLAYQETVKSSTKAKASKKQSKGGQELESLKRKVGNDTVIGLPPENQHIGERDFLPVNRKMGSDTVIGLSTQSQNKREQEFESVNRKLGSDTIIRLSPQVFDEKSDKIPDSGLQEQQWTGVDVNKGKVIDLTNAADEDNFQSLSGTSYADLRAEAQAHAAIRKEWLRKAAQAYINKQAHVASYCAEEARKQGNLMKDANARAAALIFQNKNSNRNGSEEIDLHGLHCDEAVEVLEVTLDQAPSYNKKFVDIITGRGAHSKGRKPKVKMSVMNYLNGNGYRFTKLNEGCLRVYLR